jgi:predicted transcriptional regulator
MEHMKVGDIMTEHVITVKTTCDVKTLVHMFLRYRISGVPVVDTKKRIVGVITMNAVMKRIYDRLRTKEYTLHEVFAEIAPLKARDLMNREFVRATPQMTVAEVFERAVATDVLTVPVVENDRLLGVIGLRDVLNIGLHEEAL